MLKIKLRSREISTPLPAFVMGIVNATPDSFWKESRGGLELALRQIEDGADLLDLGAESSRPGSSYIPEEEEISRLLPLIREIRKVSDIPLSIDTRKKNVMQAAFEAGADILNDISALEDDEEMAGWCAEKEIPVVLMHKRGNPSEMQEKTDYANAFSEVNEYLESRIQYALERGILPEKIIIDPGIGFGKDLQSNVQLIKNCGKLCGGNFPVLMALSRKSVVGEITGRPVEERLAGTLALNMLAVQNGATILRVHDVKETIDTLRIMNYIK